MKKLFSFVLFNLLIFPVLKMNNCGHDQEQASDKNQIALHPTDIYQHAYESYNCVYDKKFKMSVSHLFTHYASYDH